jgi:plasmid maintenance system antidote protein VapI
LAFPRTRSQWLYACPRRGLTISRANAARLRQTQPCAWRAIFGTSAEFWLGLQSDYDMKIALAENGARINQDVSPMEQAA